MMRLRHLYLGLCVIGVVAPYAQLIPWIAQHGLQLGLFVRELFATRIGAFFGLDVVVSAIVLFVFLFAERAALRIRHLWLPVVATLVVGVSLGLPLFLYMRERVRDRTKTI
jgi:Terpene cyclase DEP1